jgi:hypothetical protein
MSRSETAFLVAAMIGLSILFSGCGSSSPASPTARPAPTVPPDGGMVGAWSYSDDSQLVTVRFGTKGTSDMARAAEVCRVAMNGEPVVWVTVSAENKTGDQLQLSEITIVTGAGQQLTLDNAVMTIGDWYVNAPDSPAREACVETAGRVADNQIEGGVAPGATVVALESVPATVTSVKSVTTYGYLGHPIALAYGS